MTGPQARIVIVGGGIMGASLTWHLAVAGARFTLIDRDLAIAGGATASSYGWVGTGSNLPSHDPAGFALRLEAMAEFGRLGEALGPLPVAARGALVWRNGDQETAAWIAEQRTAGASVEALGRDAVAAREPRLASPPALAAWFPGDFAVEPARLARLLLDAAASAGAVLRRGSVDRIEMAGARAIGVRVDGEFIAADLVVLANGCGALPLAAAIGVALPVTASPAVLLRFAAEQGTVRHLLQAQHLELRPMLGGGLALATAPPGHGEDLSALAAKVQTAIADLLGLDAPLPIAAATLAHRPITSDGIPLRGFVPGVEGLYALIAHPGVILAPLLGRLAAADIVGA